MRKSASVKQLCIRHITVRRGKLDLEVAVPLDLLRVSDASARRVLELLPNLANHVCVNGRGDGSFGDELVGTESAHLLEHVIIELQGQVHAGEKRRPQLTGHTSWLEELAVTRKRGHALMRVTVTFACDLAAIGAARTAAGIVNWALAGANAAAPDVAAEVQNIQEALARRRQAAKERQDAL